MADPENPWAGQGPVLIDVGGEVGALVVTMPAELEGREIGIHATRHDHAHGHDDSNDSHRGHAHIHSHGGTADRHVAVHARQMGSQIVYSAVFGELSQGTYQLYELPDGPMRVQVSVNGGEVTHFRWPGATAG